MSCDRRVVTERELDRFREEELSPEHLLATITRHVWVLFRLAVGVGKTRAICRLLGFPRLFERFELVVYAAPTWTIIDEVVEALNGMCVGAYLVLKPRPSSRCGSLDEAWQDLEERGCSALAKRRLCDSACSERAVCDWPDQLKDIKKKRIILSTEQRFASSRVLIPLLKQKTGAKRVLLILDEGHTLDASLEVQVDRDRVGKFLDVVRSTKVDKSGWSSTQSRWVASTNRLLGMGENELRGGLPAFPRDLHRYAYQIQERGEELYGDQFSYLGYDLSLLSESRESERWADGNAVTFIARPYLTCHVALFSAHVTAEYAGHRMGTVPLRSPYEGVRFLHSESRMINLRNSAGAARHFPANMARLLDAFAVLIFRNIVEERSTLLVSKKKFKCACSNYLERRLVGWGLRVRFVTDDYASLPEHPHPQTVPIIHYGILGVNDFTDYQTAYCLNSYYVQSAQLSRFVQDAEPRHFRVDLEITRGPDFERRVKLASRGVNDEDREWLGNVYLRKLEVDPVVQAAGRVRFHTKRREVVFFQMNDLQREVGPVEEVRGVSGLLDAFGLPAARTIDQAMEGKRARVLMAAGCTAEEAAHELGMSRASVFRRLRALESLKIPKKDLLRDSETLPPPGGPQGGCP